MNSYDRLCEYVIESEKEDEEHIKTTAKSRKQNLVFIRQLCIFLGKEILGMSYKELGEKFGKDHATAMHAYKVIKNYLGIDKVKTEKICEYLVTIPQIVKFVPSEFKIGVVIKSTIKKSTKKKFQNYVVDIEIDPITANLLSTDKKAASIIFKKIRRSLINKKM